MEDTRAITIIDSDPRAIDTRTQDSRPVWSVDLAIAQWLDAKEKHTHSQRTRDDYEKLIRTFRAALQHKGLDLDSVEVVLDAEDMPDKRETQRRRDQVKQLAQLFAGFSARGRQVKPTTFNHRYAVLSSFYAFCIKQEWLDYNPIDHLERAKVERNIDKKSLDFDDVASMFDRFDVSKLEDARDSALLAVALATGHRVSALAGLRWKHVSVRRGGIVTLYFERCKGNKNTSVELDAQASKVLLRWLKRFYGQELGKLSGDSPLWVSLTRAGYNRRTKQYEPSYGKSLSIQALGQICQKWAGTAHIHRLRNTFVMGMLEAGASLREIQGKLLHSSLATTSNYVDDLTESKNTHAGQLSKLFNIK